MHPLETSAGVPAFLAKLWRLVEDKETNDLISWSAVSFKNDEIKKHLCIFSYRHDNLVLKYH